ncbi:MAG TPA: hypothetical protein DEP82_14695 [Arthrobacter bacterium]|nr:hypothetical protein [Arthrobacter sp.]HCB59120.1 hypothetical protein [Arthrobacter sp.]
MSKQAGGHPARQDERTAKLFRAMKHTVELVRDLDGALSEDAMLCLKAAALGQMQAYSELTGLPAPVTIINNRWDLAA